MSRFLFPKSRRLRAKSQFKAVLAQRAYASDQLLRVSAAKNDISYSRLGVSITKSLGSSPLRNRLKRLVREAFRLNQESIPAGYDYIVCYRFNWFSALSQDSPKNAAKTIKTRQVADSLVKLTVTAAAKTS
ncbi:MAG: ribonuclease P protein component [Phycisphaerae bacterium]